MDTIYVRFGDLPKSGKSHNYLTKGDEKEVSCYEALLRDGKLILLLPTPSIAVAQSMHEVFSRPAFLVRGALVGFGGDGEPVLQDCDIVAPIAKVSYRGGLTTRLDLAHDAPGATGRALTGQDGPRRARGD